MLGVWGAVVHKLRGAALDKHFSREGDNHLVPFGTFFCLQPDAGGVLRLQVGTRCDAHWRRDLGASGRVSPNACNDATELCSC